MAIKIGTHEVDTWSRVYAAVVAACLVDRRRTDEAADAAEERADAAVLALRVRLHFDDEECGR